MKMLFPFLWLKIFPFPFPFWLLTENDFIFYVFTFNTQINSKKDQQIQNKKLWINKCEQSVGMNIIIAVRAHSTLGYVVGLTWVGWLVLNVFILVVGCCCCYCRVIEMFVYVLNSNMHDFCGIWARILSYNDC